ncbi:SCO family protein [Leptospira sp. GIMC2001]|uniref:SCO family protein n=1 Tax=Leptospira sp. GIMC2001 TaxID=1513297 RepID=UPI00234BFDC2|nr:SCO family protein [Leptospira sp. GIMC2001]WCL48947.1 SCO family protein [Leptospira sp. GIMC2001]
MIQKPIVKTKFKSFDRNIDFIQRNLWVRISYLVIVGILFLSTVDCKKEDFTPVGIGGDFSLIGMDGKNWKLSENAKPINLIFFGYTSCPDYCPMTLSKLSKVKKQLGNDADQVQIVFISVDSKKDNYKNIQSYVSFYDPNAIGLVGDKNQIDSVVKLFGAHYEVNDSTIDHSTYLYLLDDKTTTRYLFKHADSPEKIVEIIRLLL